MAGLAVVGASVLLFVEPDRSFEATFGAVASSSWGPGLGLLVAGLGGMLYAVTMIAGRAEDRGSWWQKAITLPGRVLGVLLFLGCLGLAAAGVARLVAPGVYERAARSVQEALPRAPQLKG